MRKSSEILYDQQNDIVDKLLRIKELNNNLEKCQIEKNDLFINYVKDIIEVIDTFEKAEEIINERGLNQQEESKKVINRYTTIQKRLFKILQKRGVSQLQFPENKLIIGFCDVVETEPNPDLENDTIIKVVRNGYIHGKELIREAEVIIVKN
jgi:molecular chaperone GrpE (heat shock protein)